jgi:hypothetical protein
VKLRRRTPTVLKWTGASLCALNFTTWVASGWRTLMVAERWTGYNFLVIANGGTLQVCRFGSPLSPSTRSRAVRPRSETPLWTWWDFGINAIPSGPNSWELYAPLWVPFLLVGIPSVMLWRSDHVRPLGACRTCGYDLSGLTPGGACPECGKGMQP